MYILCTEEPGSARPRLGAGRAWPRPRAAAVVYFGPSSLPRHQGGRTRRELRRAATQTHTTLCRYAALHCSLRIISTDFFPTIRVDHASGIRLEVLLRSPGTGTEADLAGKFYSRDKNVSNRRLIFLFCYLRNVCKKWCAISTITTVLL